MLEKKKIRERKKGTMEKKERDNCQGEYNDHLHNMVCLKSICLLLVTADTYAKEELPYTQHRTSHAWVANGQWQSHMLPLSCEIIGSMDFDLLNYYGLLR